MGASGSYKTITYTNARRSSNYPNAMSTSTGVFTAPLAGTYQFIIQVRRWSGLSCYVEMKLEGNTVSYIEDNNKPNALTITGTAIIDMQPGQKAWAETYNKLYSTSSDPMIHFTGVL